MAMLPLVSSVSMVGLILILYTSRMSQLIDERFLDKTPSLHLPRTLDRDATIRMSALQTRAPSEVKSSPVARNRSLREYKVPPGPRIPDQDFTKRSPAPY